MDRHSPSASARLAGLSQAPRVLCGWLVKLKMLWLASLLIVFALLAAPNGRPASFLFFVVTVDHPSSRVFSSDAPNASLSVRGKFARRYRP
jgi:hypothetical protein